MNKMPFTTCFVFSIIFLACSSNPDNRDLSTKEIPAERNIDSLSAVEITGLLYHRFGETQYPSTSIGADLFENHLIYLKEHSIECITFSQSVELLKNPKSTGRYCTITIDDAFKSFYRTGYPLLKKYGIKATLFMNTSTLGAGDYMNEEEVREVLNYGIEIGNHTHSHSYFLNIPDSDRISSFKQDVLSAQRILDKKFGINPLIYAHPFGEYDGAMKTLLKELGFSAAAAQNSGIISKYADLYALPRFPMNDTYGEMELFQQKIKAKALPVRYSGIRSTISAQNPPILKIEMLNTNLDISRLQCFIQGGDCQITHQEDGSAFYEITANKKLTNRRHLYTITVPGNKPGEWFWFSHQWIFPEN